MTIPTHLRSEAIIIHDRSGRVYCTVNRNKLKYSVCHENRQEYSVGNFNDSLNKINFKIKIVSETKMSLLMIMYISCHQLLILCTICIDVCETQYFCISEKIVAAQTYVCPPLNVSRQHSAYHDKNGMVLKVLVHFTKVL